MYAAGGFGLDGEMYTVSLSTGSETIFARNRLAGGTRFNARAALLNGVIYLVGGDRTMRSTLATMETLLVGNVSNVDAVTPWGESSHSEPHIVDSLVVYVL